MSKNLTNKDINKIIGDIDTGKPVEIHESEVQLYLNELRGIIQFCMETSDTIEAGFTKVGLMLYPHREVFEAEGGKHLKKAFALADKAIAERRNNK